MVEVSVSDTATHEVGGHRFYGGCMKHLVTGRVVEAVSHLGISDVVVSNGEHLVVTDANGNFSLPADEKAHRFIFLTLPDSHCAELGFYKRVQKETLDMDTYTFIVKFDPNFTRRPLRFTHVSDTHLTIGGSKSLTSYESLVQDLRVLESEAEPTFVVASGDLTDRGTSEELTAYKRATLTCSCPVFSMFGGHDGIDESRANKTETSTRHYEQTLGPTYYSFNASGWHFILFPNEDAFFTAADVARKSIWLKQDLTAHEEKPTIFITHKPPPRKFLDYLQAYDVRLILHGHWHSCKVFRHGKTLVASTPSLSFGGIDTMPRGYRLVEIEGEHLTTRYRPLSTPSQKLQTKNMRSVGVFRQPALNANSLSFKWNTQLPGTSHRSGLIVQGDILLASVSDGNDASEAGVCRLDCASGDVTWHTRLDASVKNAVAVSDSICVAQSITGRLYAISTDSGTVRWQADLPGFPDRWLFASPLIMNGFVYAGGKGGFGAFDLTDGSQVWYTTFSSIDAWPCYASPIPLNDLIILLVAKRGIFALSQKDGRIAWETDLKVDYIHGSPLLFDGGVLVDEYPGGMVLLDGHTGHRRWAAATNSETYLTGICAFGEYLLSSNGTGNVCCYHTPTGKAIWQYQTGQALLAMRPYVRGGPHLLVPPTPFHETILVGGTDGWLHMLTLESGTLMNEYFLGSPVTSLAAASKAVYVATYSGKVWSWGKK